MPWLPFEFGPSLSFIRIQEYDICHIQMQLVGYPLKILEIYSSNCHISIIIFIRRECKKFERKFLPLKKKQ